MADFPHSYKTIPSLLADQYNDTKTWVMPTNKQHYRANHKNDLYKYYDDEVVSIDDIIRANDLDNPIALNNHAEIWSPTQSEDDIDPSKFKYDSKKDIDKSDLIYGTRKLNGDIILSNGRHRIRALKNDGYTHAKIPITNEILTDEYGLRDTYYTASDPKILNGIASTLPSFYKHDPKLIKEVQRLFREQAKKLNGNL